MDTALSRIISQAHHIAQICSDHGKPPTIPLKCSGRTPNLTSMQITPDVSELFDTLPCAIQSRLRDALQQAEADLGQKYIQEYHATISCLGSLEAKGGREDSWTEWMVIRAFETAHSRDLSRLVEELGILLKTHMTGDIVQVHLSGNPSVFGLRAVNVLETAFQRKDTLNNAETVALSQMSGITPHQVRTWFQNRRNRARKQARKDGSASKTPQPPPPPPPSSAAITTDSTSRPLSALPRRGQKLPLFSSYLATPNLNMEKTTPDATGTGRRVRAMPKRAFPPTSQKPKAIKPAFAYSTLKTEVSDGISPSPSMARSLSAHSSDGSISSEDPSGGFNSLLNPPLDAPPQVSLTAPQEDWGIDWSWPAVAGFGLGGMDLEPDMGMFNFGGMEVELPMQTEIGLDLPRVRTMGGEGMQRVRSDGTDGLGAMGGLTLAGPSILAGSNPLDGMKDDHTGMIGIQGEQAEQGDSLDWLKFLQWDDEEPANGDEEFVPTIGEAKGQEAESGTMSQQEITVSPVDISPPRSHSGSSSRSLTPPPLPQTAHFIPAPPQSGMTAHTSPVNPAQAIDASHFLPSQVPQHHFHSYSAQYAHHDGYDSPSRIPSYGSVASTASTRIITPPSADFYNAHTGQSQHIRNTHQSQDGKVKKHNRTPSGEGLTKVSSWTAPSLDQVAERSTTHLGEHKDQQQEYQGQPIYRLDSYYPLRVDENANPTLTAPPGMAHPALYPGSGQVLHPQNPNLCFHPSHPSHPSQLNPAYPAYYRQHFPTQPITSPNPRHVLNMTIPVSSSRSTDITQSSGSSSPPVQSAHTSPVQDHGKVQVSAQVPTSEAGGGEMSGEWLSGVMPFEGSYGGDWNWQDQA